MSDPVIQVENLGKKYIIGHQQQERYTALRDAIAKGIKSAGSKILSLIGDQKEQTTREEFWAIEDVSFEVNRGDRVGIIGRNGAGKSTLLKILSRITEPTKGRVSIKGRVASLLEVGTGFHGELSGRENIYLNGAILGMSKAEIKRKFDEIVAFAEIEKFLDTPVKRYSSGMYVRLAFAVAAHLDPDILVVDEVLAVGDAAFQNKCLGKMEEVGKQGRTVILVSHSMASIQALANRALFLEKGRTEGISLVTEAVHKYLYGGAFGSAAHFITQDNSNKDAYIVEAKLLNERGEITDRFAVYDPIFIEITWINKNWVPVIVGFQLDNLRGVIVMTAYDTPIDWDGKAKKSEGKYVSNAKIPANLLNANEYIMHISLDSANPRFAYDTHYDAIRFTVYDPMNEKCIARGDFKDPYDYMALFPALEWSWNKGLSEPEDNKFVSTP